MKRVFAAAMLILFLVIAAGCGSRKPKGLVMRVGYFPNLTHAQAVIGAANGRFRDAMPAGVKVDFKVFNAGPSAIEALFAGAIDMTYVGPNPAINGFLKSGGKSLRIVAGTSSGGAVFVVRPAAGITRPGDLSGKTLASPQLGNTQDVALRDYLAANGLTPVEKGGTVKVTPIANPDILTLFRRGQIDGAWVPEPWGARLVHEGGGRVFLDERDLWPAGRFTTALVAVSTRFLKDHPDLVRAWLREHVELTLWVRQHPEEAKRIVNGEILRLTGKSLPERIMDDAFGRLEITYDPLVPTLEKMAVGAYQAGFLGEKPPVLEGICDLTHLTQILKEKGLPPVKP